VRLLVPAPVNRAQPTVVGSSLFRATLHATIAQELKDNQAYTWFAKLMAYGELT
jgi:hypothetical protein